MLKVSSNRHLAAVFYSLLRLSLLFLPVDGSQSHLTELVGNLAFSRDGADASWSVCELIFKVLLASGLEVLTFTRGVSMHLCRGREFLILIRQLVAYSRPHFHFARSLFSSLLTLPVLSNYALYNGIIVWSLLVTPTATL